MLLISTLLHSFVIFPVTETIFGMSGCFPVSQGQKIVWTKSRQNAPTYCSHPVFRNDMNLAIFLEYDKELNVRGKNKKERLFDVFSSMQKSGDELLLTSTVKDCNEFFENERRFLLEYFNHMRDATHKSDKMVVLHKSLAENYIKISSGFMDLSALDETNRGSDDKVSL